MKNTNHYSIPCLCFILFTILSAIPSLGATLSGTISLPNGAVAPADGYVLLCYIENVNGGGGGLCGTDLAIEQGVSGPLIIPEGNSSISYSATIPDSPDASVMIKFVGFTDDIEDLGYIIGTDYMGLGYYSAGGTVLDPEEATMLSGGQNYTGINMTLIQGRKISGTVYYPDGANPSGESSIRITAKSTVDSGFGSYIFKFIDMLPGASSADYTLLVRPDTDLSFTVYYLYTIGEVEGLGYYTPTETVCNKAEATYLSGEQDHFDIDLNLPYIIEGTVSLPSGHVAPPGGLSVDIDAGSCSHQSISVTIPENSSTAPYSLHLLSTDSYIIRVNYTYNGNESYAQTGYYSSTGTVAQSYSATSLPGGENHTGIDLTLLGEIAIEGTVFLPSGTAPAGGVDVTIWTRTIGGGVGSFDSAAVTIQEGESSAPYSLTVLADPNAQWRIYYNYTGMDYHDTGYYNQQGTTPHYSLKDELPGGRNYSGIDLTLLPVITISGEVSLPGADNRSPVEVRVRASDGITSYSETITIFPIFWGPPLPYRLKILDNPGSQWRISYDFFYHSDDDMYFAEGYYAQGGTTGYPSEATLLPGGQNYTGIDMALLAGKAIEGIISLPFGLAPAGGVQITASIISSDQSYTISQDLTILEGNSSVAYQFIVPDEVNDQWIVSYNYYGNEYTSSGYYTQEGTVSFQNQATMLNGGQHYNGIDMTLLIGKTIQGEVSLPSGTAPAGGIAVAVVVNSPYGDYEDRSYVTIPEGDFAAPYFVKVPDDMNRQWRISYIYSGDSYMPKGYYANTGTNWQVKNADLLVGGIEHSGINLTLLDQQPRITITGKILLPKGIIAKDLYSRQGQGAQIIVFDAENSQFLTSYYSFNVGDNSISYEIEVPKAYNTSWWIGYSLRGFDYPDGFYRSNGTTLNFSRATPLSANVNHSGIDMTITDQEVAPLSITPILMLLLQ